MASLPQEKEEELLQILSEKLQKVLEERPPNPVKTLAQ